MVNENTDNEINLNKIVDETVKKELIDHSFGFEYKTVTNLLDLLIVSRSNDEKADALNYESKDEKEMERLQTVLLYGHRFRHKDFKILFFAIGGIVRYEDPKVDKYRQEILARQMINFLG